MAEITSPMDIDDGPTFKPNKGKTIAAACGDESTLWVEKYRPQSLADVAAHRDIIDTSSIFRIRMPTDVRVQLINDMADIEHRLSFGCSDKLQLGALIASFTKARSALVAAAK